MFFLHSPDCGCVFTGSQRSRNRGRQTITKHIKRELLVPYTTQQMTAPEGSNEGLYTAPQHWRVFNVRLSSVLIVSGGGKHFAARGFSVPQCNMQGGGSR
jgi:hypothetical protein